MKQTLKIILGSALATAAVIKAMPVLAEPSSAQAVSIVRTADLDLSSAAGRRTLDHRLAIAATEVCGTAADVDLAGRNGVRQCVKDVIAQARLATSEFAAGRIVQRDIRVAAR
jgi:UrcA family protein